MIYFMVGIESVIEAAGLLTPGYVSETLAGNMGTSTGQGIDHLAFAIL